MNIAIVDDMETELQRINSILQDYKSEHSLDLKITTYTRGKDLLQEYRPLKYTVIFMDIYMDDISGIHLAEEIRSTDKDTLIVFLTTSHEHFPDAFQVHAYDYIIKPVNDLQLRKSIFQCMDDIANQQSTNTPKFNFMYNRNSYSIPYSDILCVRSNKHNTEIITVDNNYTPRLTFSSVKESLSSDTRFLQINRGILINMDYITSFDQNICILQDNLHLPIKVKNKTELNQIRQNYVFNKIHNEINERG